jgi:hypothetical protein
MGVAIDDRAACALEETTDTTDVEPGWSRHSYLEGELGARHRRGGQPGARPRIHDRSLVSW